MTHVGVSACAALDLADDGIEALGNAVGDAACEESQYAGKVLFQGFGEFDQRFQAAVLNGLRF